MKVKKIAKWQVLALSVLLLLLVGWIGCNLALYLLSEAQIRQIAPRSIQPQFRNDAIYQPLELPPIDATDALYTYKAPEAEAVVSGAEEKQARRRTGSVIGDFGNASAG